eukprot:c17111_g1_i5.p1 GENE.c17111_g1_i5~~c17111_g1_i5.p1  ORF type:complete len:270 (+),score=59.03 c17111_g1_i5:257-1066(+)
MIKEIRQELRQVLELLQKRPPENNPTPSPSTTAGFMDEIRRELGEHGQIRRQLLARFEAMITKENNLVHPFYETSSEAQFIAAASTAIVTHFAGQGLTAAHLSNLLIGDWHVNPIKSLINNIVKTKRGKMSQNFTKFFKEFVVVGLNNREKAAVIVPGPIEDVMEKEFDGFVRACQKKHQFKSTAVGAMALCRTVADKHLALSCGLTFLVERGVQFPPLVSELLHKHELTEADFSLGADTLLPEDFIFYLYKAHANRLRAEITTEAPED